MGSMLGTGVLWEGRSWQPKKLQSHTFCFGADKGPWVAVQKQKSVLQFVPELVVEFPQANEFNKVSKLSPKMLWNTSNISIFLPVPPVFKYLNTFRYLGPTILH